MRPQSIPNTFCRHCKQPFYIKPSQLKRGRGKFCSTQCHDLYRAGDLAERFWPLVDMSGGEDACWPFTGCIDGRGYGVIKFRGKQEGAHRVSYELTYGELPDDQCACHTCDNPPCCNPKHLFAGTTQENTLDMIAKQRHTLGSRNGNALLTEDKVREMRALHGTMKVADIAERFGIAYSTAEGILYRRSWKHVA